ncbi:glycine-rich domain-containing protein [Roseomonas sp. F4]
MDRIHHPTAGASPPAVDSHATPGYPNNATILTPWAFHQVVEELRAIIVAGGGTPDKSSVTQVRDNLANLYKPGRLIGVQVFSASGTYTPSAGTASVVVEAVGGGGGGGGAVISGSGNCAAALPGNAGAYGKGRYTSSFSGVTVTIGAGGTGGTGASGGNGGTTSFGALLSCPGGPGGGPGAAEAGSASGGNGNTSGLPSGANVVGAVGGLGGPTFGFSTGQVAFAGAGGSSHFGSGGVGASANLTGGNAQTPGSGGAGSFGQENSATLTGGNGAVGRVIVWEFA